jgi:hypothetical protein
MKKVKNLTENKGLINTFKKLKTKLHLNKSSLKNSSFYLFKYGNLFFFKNYNKINTTNIKCVFFRKFLINKKTIKQNSTYFNKSLVKITLMFIN